MMLLSTGANVKNLIITAVETKGPLDASAIEAAFVKALDRNPLFHSHIHEVRKGFQSYFVRRPDPHMKTQFILKNVSNNLETSILESYLELFSERLDQRRDLFCETPSELHVLSVGQDRHFIAPVFHHSATDGARASEFGREFMANYHELTTGNRPKWASSPLATSSARKRLVGIKRKNENTYIKDARQAIKQMLDRPILPIGNGTPGDTRQFQIKQVLSYEHTELLIKAAMSAGASLVDLLVSGSSTAIDEWNRARGVPEGFVGVSVSVNMQGRFKDFERQNNSGLIYFRSHPEERRDLRQFTRKIAINRINQFRNQLDFKFFQDVSRTNALLRLIPLDLRIPAMHFLMNLHKFSVAVTLLGVIWPEIKNGRPTREASFSSTGELEITGVNGLGYKLLSSTPLLLMVYFYDGKLNIVLASAASHFTKEESRQFLDLFVQRLKGWAEETCGK